MFSDELNKISWDEVSKEIYAKTDADVRRALQKESCDVNDFMALISPAAEPYLEQMAFLSRHYTFTRTNSPVRSSSRSLTHRTSLLPPRLSLRVGRTTSSAPK